MQKLIWTAFLIFIWPKLEQRMEAYIRGKGAAAKRPAKRASKTRSSVSAGSARFKAETEAARKRRNRKTG